MGVGHRCGEGAGGRRVSEGFCDGAQDVSRDPALRGGGLAVGGTVNQVHVLLVRGENLDHLALRHVDLVLLERGVVLSDQHGGRDAVAAAVAVPGIKTRAAVGGRHFDLALASLCVFVTEAHRRRGPAVRRPARLLAAGCGAASVQR